MYRFIESICYEQGSFQRIGLHNDRCNRTRNQFFGPTPPLFLETFLSVPFSMRNDIVKCTVTYGVGIFSIDYAPYTIRKISSMRLIYENDIDYSHKYADRAKLNSLFQDRGQCDDILIVKDGLITDSYYANAIFKFNNRWYSQKNPLLHGTRLESYLHEKRVFPELIKPDDLSSFSEVRIINAMISIENSPVIPIGNIIK